MASSSASYLIGVDTGGTYTDAALIEARGHRVVARAKAITTKGDLAIGVVEAITQAVAQLPQGLQPRTSGWCRCPRRWRRMPSSRAMAARSGWC
jgi:N-acetylglucosamine kinase-like BadF-type ATPase